MMSRLVRSLAISFLVALVVGGAVSAAAASLGGLQTSALSANSATVATHSSGIAVRWLPVFEKTGWVLDSVTLSAVGGDTFASSESVRVAIVDGRGVAVCEPAVVVAFATTSFTLDRATLDKYCGGPVALSRVASVALVAAR
jgi:hypothetical protein